MSCEAHRRQLQSHLYDLAQSSPGTYRYSIEMDNVVSDKCQLATCLFWEGIREESRVKVQEALDLINEAINYYTAVHYDRDMLIMQLENRADWQVKLQDELWWDRSSDWRTDRGSIKLISASRATAPAIPKSVGLAEIWLLRILTLVIFSLWVIGLSLGGSTNTIFIVLTGIPVLALWLWSVSVPLRRLQLIWCICFIIFNVGAIIPYLILNPKKPSPRIK